MGVVLGEDQHLGDVDQTPLTIQIPTGEHGGQVVSDRPDDGADLVLGHDLAVEIALVVGDVLIDRLQPLFSRFSVAELGDIPRCCLNRGPALGDGRRQAEHVEVDVDPIGDRLRKPVLHHQVLVEEAKRLLAGRGSEADEEGVEVLEHLTPHAIDRTVALVDDDHIEGLDGQVFVVVDLDGALRFVVERGVLVEFLLERVVAPEDGVHPLNGADTHLGHRVDDVRREALDVFELGELPACAGHVEALKLFERLIAEVGTVDQEQNALGAALGDEALRNVGGCKRLTRPGGHLDKRPRPVVLERPFEVGDRLVLRIPEPGGELLCGQRLDVVQSCPQRAALGVDAVLDHGCERRRLVEPEHAARGGLWVEPARKPGVVAS